MNMTSKKWRVETESEEEVKRFQKLNKIRKREFEEKMRDIREMKKTLDGYNRTATIHLWMSYGLVGISVVILGVTIYLGMLTFGII